MASEKETNITNVALALFAKFGFHKVTMGEIAKAAGISRPTLYALFPKKHAIFGSFVRSHFRQMEIETDERLRKTKTLKGQLDVIFDVWVIVPVSQALTSQSTKDFVANCEIYAPDAVKDMYDKIENYFLNCFQKVARSSEQAVNAARILREATKGLKTSTTDVEDLKKQLKTLTVMTLGLFPTP